MPRQVSSTAAAPKQRRPKAPPADPLPRHPFAAQCPALLAGFLAQVPPGGRVGIICHSDADGVPAGALLARVLEANGYGVAVEVTGKFENAWSDAVRERASRHEPQALCIVDLGIRPEPILPGLPTCFLDHHHFTAAPEGATVISGYGQEPCPTSGLLAWWAAAALPVRPPVLWLAAISLLSDVGDKAPFAELAEAKALYGATALREATTLLNAVRRSATGDAASALALCLRVDGPKAILSGAEPETALLRQTREEVNAAFAEAKKVGPKFAGPVAIIKIDTPCQIHPLVAQTWRTRLPVPIVIGANIGYRPGWVHFSARTAKGTDLIAFFQEHRPEGAGENYGRGHLQASGGSLPVEVWNRWVTGLGFGPELHVG